MKSEWNVPVDQLTDISFSIFLLVKVRKVQIELMYDKVVIEARGLRKVQVVIVTSREEARMGRGPGK